MLLGRLRIRGKLAVLLVVPLLSMSALAVPVLAERVHVAARADRSAHAARTAETVSGVVQELQEERLLSVGYLLGVTERGTLVRQSTVVSDRIADLRTRPAADLPKPIVTLLAGAQRLNATRSAVLAHRVSPDAVMTVFTEVITSLIDAPRTLDDVDTATPAGRQLVALDAVLRTDEQINAAGTLLVLVTAGQSRTANMRYIATMSALQVALERFHAFATVEQGSLHRLISVGAIARTGRDFLALGPVDPGQAVKGLSVAMIFPAVSSLGTLGQFVTKKLVADILSEVTALQRRALTGALTVAALVLGVLLLVMSLSVATARMVALPLTRLTHSAHRVARVAAADLKRIADDETEAAHPVRLDHVDVSSRDEIGDLARAFDRVQHTAAQLVERQTASRRNVAQMFGHIGRRTQNLVGRQIALIDRLEQQESDPARLRDLYQLDHISSRLRRNASSLVVLSGSDSSEGHMAPLPLGDVARLALGEIENYGRVDVRVDSDVLVSPAVIGDLVLVFAELMENATSFSPPHTRVTVVARWEPAGVCISVIDHGIGMPPQRLAEENARFVRRERLELAPTEFLGLFVVGRLTRRHGWQVRLSPTPGGGVTADLVVGVDDLVDAPTPHSVDSALPPAPAPQSDEPAGPSASTHAEQTAQRLVPVDLAVDSALFERASRLLTDGPRWNAFIPERQTSTGPGLTQRIPGASLAAAAPPSPATPAVRPAEDPAHVRDQLLQFEAGVRRALDGSASMPSDREGSAP
ncbi:nitrate- and nitrite sensing domain-containing protein [Micromonospora sp. NPDC049366]|uniref:sensor histidine kinase n=1 Tax=Micromonospora sp. NPDC049366 TaxID=3364271 RepID=UPI00378A2818